MTKFSTGERVRAHCPGGRQRRGTVVAVPDNDRFYLVEFPGPGDLVELIPLYEDELRRRPVRALREAAGSPVAAAVAGALGWLAAWALDS